MHSAVEPTVSALNSWINQLQNNAPYGPQPYNQVWGWNHSALSTDDLISFIKDVQLDLSSIPIEANLADLSADLSSAPTRASYITASVIPNISSSSFYVVPQIIDELNRIQRVIEPYLPHNNHDWEKLASEGYLPKKLVARLTGMETRLTRLVPRMEDLDDKIAKIDEARDTAEQLPETLQSLDEGRRAMATARTEAQSLASSAATHAREAAASSKEVEELAKKAAAKYDDLEDAHRAAATKGLASAFQIRAGDLTKSVRAWVGILMLDLAAGAGIGIYRFSELQKVLSSSQPASVIWGNLVFSILSLAAPVWLGWVATKQINQRFKLAEDYSFKASVATAYEAWKIEANRHDGDFAKRLFGSALSRIEEAPLRFMDKDNFATPWQEFISSTAFSKALDVIPDLKMAYAKFIAGAGAVTAAAGAAKKVLDGKEEDIGDKN